MSNREQLNEVTVGRWIFALILLPEIVQDLLPADPYHHLGRNLIPLCRI